MVTVKEIYKWTNISDSGCDSKIARFNDILSFFSMEIYDLYPRKIVERFTPATWKMLIDTTYPIVKVWGFYGKWCTNWCSLDPKDCCQWYKKLLLTETYWDNLDANSYSIVWDKKIEVRLPGNMTDAFIVYSKWFEEVSSVNDNIDIDRYMLSLLRLYMKWEYALDSDNDINMSANYKSLFQTKLKKAQDMYMNQMKYMPIGSLNPMNR